MTEQDNALAALMKVRFPLLCFGHASLSQSQGDMGEGVALALRQLVLAKVASCEITKHFMALLRSVPTTQSYELLQTCRAFLLLEIANVLFRWVSFC